MTFVTNLLAKIVFCVSYFGVGYFKALEVKVRKTEKGVISFDFYLPEGLGKNILSEKEGG